MYRIINFQNLKLIKKTHFNFRTYAKEIKFGTDARTCMMQGVEMLTKAVSGTLGPKGRNVIIEKSHGSPIITKDGVTVAESLILENRIENVGANILRGIAKSTNEKAGDGTTTATVLACSIAKEGLNRINKKVNAIQLRNGILKSVDVIVRQLNQMAKQITNPEELKQVASLSANNDKVIGDMISEAIRKVGKSGTVTIKDGNTLHDELELIDGMKFDRGYISPYFINSTKGSKCEFQNAYILISQKEISTVPSLVPVLELINSQQLPLLIIAEDIDSEALSALILNKLKLNLQICAVKAPGFGDNRIEILKDIATSTGAFLFGSEEETIQIEDLNLEQLGRAKEICVSRDDTLIVGGNGNSEKIQRRIEMLEDQLQIVTSNYEREKIKERLSKLSDGVAVVKIGGSSEFEVNERKDRYSDALQATLAALDEGIVVGGGLALLRCIPVLDVLNVNGDEKIGLEVVKTALQSPCYTIATNAGVNGEIVIDRLLKLDGNIGYDAFNDEYVDMFESGIIDPVKVVRTALTDAARAASLLITSEVVIVDEEEGEVDHTSEGNADMDFM